MSETNDTGLEFYKSQPEQIKRLLLASEEIREVPYYKLTYDATLPYSILVKQVEKILKAGYLQVEPVQLELLPDKELNDISYQYYNTHGNRRGTALDCDRDISQATITHNEAKSGQLYKEKIE